MAAKIQKPAGNAKNKKPPVRSKTAKQGANLSKKTKTGKPDLRENLAGELRSLIPRLDAEGLQFLIEQAQVHLYNMQVDELNKTITRARPAGTAKPPRQSEEIRIEGSGSGSSFYMFYHGQSLMFSRDEIIRLVSIVNGPGTALETAERLFYWFERERADVFALIPMDDYFDGRLKKIAQVVKKNFKVQPKK
ncbi:MAG: hypothetical protein LBG10_01460 [Treponema sp.]|jgi:hypothetical protein|nr:hypothetical protein [Treponema sp.]